MIILLILVIKVAIVIEKRIKIWYDYKIYKGTSKYSARNELREIFSSDDTKIRGNTLCIVEIFCEI